MDCKKKRRKNMTLTHNIVSLVDVALCFVGRLSTMRNVECKSLSEKDLSVRLGDSEDVNVQARAGPATMNQAERSVGLPIAASAGEFPELRITRLRELIVG
jgi:hypothetical protein